MKRVLLLMTSRTYRAGAFLDAARALGVDVVVGSERPQALAFAHPPGHLTLDFARPERAADAVAAFARRRPIDAVVAVDDDGVVLAALAAERLGLRHASAAAVRASRDKHAMRERLAAQGVDAHWFVRFGADADPEAAARRVRYPCVLKPTSLSASRGVIRADDPRGFTAAFRRTAAIAEAARASELDRGGGRWILVEEFLPGAEVAVEAVLTRGRLRVLAVFDKPDPLDGPFFEETIYVTPSRHVASALAEIAGAAARAARALGLDHGPLHAELKWDGRRAAVVEIAPRSIGGLCSRALRFSDGASLESMLLRHALGDPLDGVEREAQASGVMMLPIPMAGRLAAVHGLDDARRVAHVEDVRITIPIGDKLVPLPEGSRYLGFVFARAETAAPVEAALRAAHGALRFEIEAEQEPPGERAVP